MKERLIVFLVAFFVFYLIAGCSLFSKKEEISLTSEELEAGKKVNLTAERLEELKGKNLYEFSPKDLHEYLPLAGELYPDLQERVIHYARKGIGQPYKMYLLG